MAKTKIELHVHPFFEEYTLADIAQAAKKRDLEIVALESYNNNIFPTIQRQAETFGGQSDSTVAELNGVYFPRATEVMTKENLHLLLIGNYGQVYEGMPIREVLDSALENNATTISDHPHANAQNTRRCITPEKQEELIKLFQTYSPNLLAEWNAYCLPLLRIPLLGRDVNKLTETLADRLNSNGTETKVVTDTDLHARNLRLLRAIGTAPITIHKELGQPGGLDTSSGTALVSSINREILEGNYTNHPKYVPTTHFIEAFGLPVVLSMLHSKIPHRPRG